MGPAQFFDRARSSQPQLCSENVDHPPMPADDPASHEFMQCIWGMKGYQHWLDNGVTNQLDNPHWRERLGEYVRLNQDGAIILDVDTALTLAYMHSPEYQGQLEELYLTAIDVSTERFAFETQLFGRVNSRWEHFGRERFGEESNTLDTNSRLEASRQFATAGTLLVGLANRLTWQFAGADTHSNLSLVDFALVQPLLRNGGRVVALERLTRTQRDAGEPAQFRTLSPGPLHVRCRGWRRRRSSSTRRRFRRHGTHIVYRDGLPADASCRCILQTQTSTGETGQDASCVPPWVEWAD